MGIKTKEQRKMGHEPVTRTFYTFLIPKINRMLFSIFSIIAASSFVIFVMSLCRSITSICDIVITESFFNFDSLLVISIFPGASAIHHVSFFVKFLNDSRPTSKSLANSSGFTFS